MKTSKRIFHILLSLLLLHGSTVGFQEKISHSESRQQEETLLALPGSQLSGYTTKHEDYRNQFVTDHFALGDGKILATVRRLAELVLDNKLSISFHLSNEHMVRLENTTMIFPFHTFP
jgi:hypothetical protein